MSASRFSKLLDLANAPSSDKRRELLREVTDLFFETADVRTSRESALFDDVLRSLAREMEEQVLVELAHRFADSPDAPRELLRDLAAHQFSVAEVVLRRSTTLREDDLVRLVNEKSQAHINAIAQRETVSEKVSAAITERGDDRALGSLLGNAGAEFSRETMERVVDRARDRPALHEVVVNRHDLPIDLLNEMYFMVEGRLRKAILDRNAIIDPEELDAALSMARQRSQVKANVDAAEDMRAAEAFVEKKFRSGELKPALLTSLHKDKQHAQFLVALSRLTDLDVETLRGVLSRQDMDALAMICRASNFDRPLFVTLAVLCCGGQYAMRRAEEFGRLYSDVPLEAAQRAMRFVKVRKSAATVAAA
jgi:uncharacterized protein (DUF2336 family)